MKKKLRFFYICVFSLIIITMFTGCSTIGRFPHVSSTEVNLSQNNYRIIHSNVIGRSSGYRLLGFIPLKDPTYTDAMTNLYQTAGIPDGSAIALTNVVQEDTTLFLFLFSRNTITIRADFVEFTD